VDSSPHMATVPPIDRPFSMSWDGGSPHLIVYVRRTALERVAGQLYGDGAVELGYGMDLSGAAGRAFLRSVVELHDVRGRRTRLWNPTAHCDIPPTAGRRMARRYSFKPTGEEETGKFGL